MVYYSLLEKSKLSAPKERSFVTLNSIADVWENILKRLENELSATTIATWFEGTSAVALEGDTLLLHCPSDFKRGTI